MKANVYDLNGKVKGQIELPSVFSTPLREDVIRRAFLALQSQRRQAYGTDPEAGLRSSAHYHGKRRMRYQMIN
ncbi:MAG: 50S ribosomal protein L4, partial [Candidatus Aenigmatarchaeota archaeon]